MSRAKLDTLLVSAPSNVTYLSGFKGDSAALLVAARAQYIITDFRYYEQAESESPEFKLVKAKRGLLRASAGKINQLKPGTVGLESDALTVEQHRALRKVLKRGRLKRTTGMVKKLRQIKDRTELGYMKAAIRAAEAGYLATLRQVKEGITERDIAAELDYQMRKAGADRPGFDTIVAFQQRASLPHANPTSRKLKQGEAILIDWGAEVQGYKSDSTRVVFLGQPSKLLTRLFDTVAEAQLAGIASIQVGARTNAVDSAARDVISRAGHANHFGHGLGHGVGLDIHEGPSLGKRGATEIKPGMVFTVEPGIYLPNKGGVRIEDMVHVTEAGAEILTGLPKTLGECIL